MSNELEQHRRRIESFTTLAHGWDSYNAEPPNAIAVARAIHVLILLGQAGCIPGRIEPSLRCDPSVAGGVTIALVGEGRYSDIECFNTGSVVASTWCPGEDPVILEATNDDAIADMVKMVAKFNMR